MVLQMTGEFNILGHCRLRHLGFQVYTVIPAPAVLIVVLPVSSINVRSAAYSNTETWARVFLC